MDLPFAHTILVLGIRSGGLVANALRAYKFEKESIAVLAASVFTSKVVYEMPGGLLRSDLKGLESLEGLLVAFNLKEVDPGHSCIVVNEQNEVFSSANQRRSEWSAGIRVN